MNKDVRFLTRVAVIAACYVVVTVAFAPIGFGEIQLRVSEALTILPIFTPAAIPGLFIGCLLGNILGGAVLPDVIFGSLATLIGAAGTYFVGMTLKTGDNPIKIATATIPPILANAIIIPFVLKYAYGSPMPIPLMMLTVGIGEVLGCGVLGTVLGVFLKHHESSIFK